MVIAAEEPDFHKSNNPRNQKTKLGVETLERRFEAGELAAGK
jgi:hypothetical protein